MLRKLRRLLYILAASSFLKMRFTFFFFFLAAQCQFVSIIWLDHKKKKKPLFVFRTLLREEDFFRNENKCPSIFIS